MKQLDRLRRYWEEHSIPVDPTTGLATMAGGAYPNTPSASPGPELPTSENEASWAELTERMELPQKQQVFAGLGQENTFTLERVGCVAEVNVRVKLQFETAAGAETGMSLGLPWSVLKKGAIQANGVSGIISASGPLLEVRQKCVYRSPEHAVLNEAHSTGKVPEKTAVTWEWVIQIPIADNLTDLEGILLAQSEETALQIDLEWAKRTEIMDHEPVKVEGTVTWHVTAFTIGTGTGQHGEKIVVLPNLETLHGLVERSVNYNGSGKQESPLVRTSGDLTRYYVTLFKKGPLATNTDVLNWESFEIQYGGNQRPIVYADPNILAERNARDYLKRPTVQGIHYGILDTTVDDALRDAIRPMLLSELKSIIGVPENPEANAAIVSAQESLYPAGA